MPPKTMMPKIPRRRVQSHCGDAVAGSIAAVTIETSSFTLIEGFASFNNLWRFGEWAMQRTGFRQLVLRYTRLHYVPFGIRR